MGPVNGVYYALIGDLLLQEAFSFFFFFGGGDSTYRVHEGVLIVDTRKCCAFGSGDRCSNEARWASGNDSARERYSWLGTDMLPMLFFFQGVDGYGLRAWRSIL